MDSLNAIPAEVPKEFSELFARFRPKLFGVCFALIAFAHFCEPTSHCAFFSPEPIFCCLLRALLRMASCDL